MDSRSRTEYSILNIIAGVGGYIVNTILGFICRMVFVKCLAADYLGVNGLFTNILTMLSLAELGIGGAIVYALYKPLAENDERKIASLVKVYGTAYKVIGCPIPQDPIRRSREYSGRRGSSGTDGMSCR